MYSTEVKSEILYDVHKTTISIADRGRPTVPLQRRPVSIGIHANGIIWIHIGVVVLGPVQPLRRPIFLHLLHVPHERLDASAAVAVVVVAIRR